jgi:hypothetical protein
MMGRMTKSIPLLSALATAVAALAIAAGCGEKEEPSTSGPEPSASGDATGFDIIGSWEGKLRQRKLKPFRVSATIGSLDDPRQNTVSYTGIDCDGRWTYLGMAGDAFRFREVIARGQGGDCKGVGTVTLTPTPAGGLDYLFRGGGVSSRGVLTRTGG